jgi:hypothetical protein
MRVGARNQLFGKTATSGTAQTDRDSSAPGAAQPGGAMILIHNSPTGMGGGGCGHTDLQTGARRGPRPGTEQGCSEG